MKSNQLETPIISVDIVIFVISNKKLFVLTCKRTNDPFIGAPALPGTAIKIDETLEAASKRALKEKTKFSNKIIKSISLNQLATFDSLYRDPRGRTISVVYMGIYPEAPLNTDDILWIDAFDQPSGSMPFDHNLILNTAVSRLSGKLRYTTIAKSFLPENFRIEELQEIYETILRRPLNKSNFRNKLIKIGIIEQVSILSNAVGKQGGRPPHIYKFSDKNIIERDFI
ncbi:MAG: NUDIX hydrolase [Desulfobacterales bacterium]|nr:NUDIX hydrolase [Desulfobacterales bacterium]